MSFSKLAEMLVSSRDRHLAQVTVAKGIERKATYGQIQGHYERLELCRQLYAYINSTSPPIWDLEYFDRSIFVAQYTITQLST
jgi:hypothetical protein